MNILFVNYGDFTANSLNHIGLFARALSARGHACVVAVPSDKDTIRVIAEPAFVPKTFDEISEAPLCFPDGRGADILHAWTPRENVRRFTLAYRHAVPSRILVHLEDNEDHLLSAMLGCRVNELRTASGLKLADTAPRALSHPVRYRAFLRVVDGVTTIVDTLREFVPEGIPALALPPGVDFSLYRPQLADVALRAELGLRDGEKVIVYTGSNTFANEREIRELYEAVALLNARGMATRLVRTGLYSTSFSEPLPAEWTAYVVDMGFVEKSKLPQLLALADVLVQPGHVGAFNDYRLPSKLPEMLAMGRPVIAPASNVGRTLRNGIDAVLLTDGSAEEMADACERVFRDATLARTLAANAAIFAEAHFDLGPISGRLEAFYRAALERSSRIDSFGPWAVDESELAPALRALGVRDSADGELSYIEHLSRLEIGDLVGKWHAATEQLEFAERALALTRQHATNLAGQVDHLSEKVAHCQSQAAQSQSEVEHWQSQAAQSQSEVEHWQSQAAQSQSEVEHWQSQAAQSQSEVEHWQSQAAQSQSEVAHWQSQAAQSQSEVEHWQKQAAQSQSEVEHWQKQAAQSQSEVEHWQKLAETLGEDHRLAALHIQHLDRELVRVREEGEARVRAFKQTWSWKLTLPLRALRRLAQRCTGRP